MRNEKGSLTFSAHSHMDKRCAGYVRRVTHDEIADAVG